MKRKTKFSFIIAGALLCAFVTWTVAIAFMDRSVIGPCETTVGFATVNRAVHEFFGVHMSLYIITDWLSILPVVLVMVFAGLGLVQWVKRKSLLKVDYSILVLGGFFATVFATFFLFEKLCINYRPILIEGQLEASYPSSTTMLVMCVMPVVAMQVNERVKCVSLKAAFNTLNYLFTAFMVGARLVSGVHWFTDIVGGALVSAGLVMVYYSVRKLKK